MKKTLIVLTITSIFATSTVIADEHSGWRVGGGYISNSSSVSGSYKEIDNNQVETHTGEAQAEDGFFIEGGYDFNKIIGVKFTASKTGFNATDDDTGNNQTNLDDYKADTKSLSISSDIGYTFNVGNFDIKPYGEVGYQTSTHEVVYTDYYGSGSDVDEFTAGSSGAIYGLGVRATYNDNWYSDLNLMKFDTSAEIDDRYDTSIDNAQLRISLGYKF